MTIGQARSDCSWCLLSVFVCVWKGVSTEKLILWINQMRHFKCWSLITAAHHPYVTVSWLVPRDVTSGTRLSAWDIERTTGEQQQVPAHVTDDACCISCHLHVMSKSVACRILCVATVVVVCFSVSVSVRAGSLAETGSNTDRPSVSLSGDLHWHRPMALTIHSNTRI